MKLLDDYFLVAQIGKTVGLNGELKLHLHCDFPEQLKKNNTFFTNKQNKLIIENYIQSRAVVKFVGFDNKEDASMLINQLLLSDMDSTKANCMLKKNEYFWFDVIGSEIIENGKLLGKVIDIERFEPNDYLIVKTNNATLHDGYVARFMIPYIDRYVLNFDKENKKIFTKDTLGILENS